MDLDRVVYYPQFNSNVSALGILEKLCTELLKYTLTKKSLPYLGHKWHKSFIGITLTTFSWAIVEAAVLWSMSLKLLVSV